MEFFNLGELACSGLKKTPKPLGKKNPNHLQPLLWPCALWPNLTGLPSIVLLPCSFPANISVNLTFTSCTTHSLSHLNELGIVSRTARLRMDHQSISSCLALPLLKHGITKTSHQSAISVKVRLSSSFAFLQRQRRCFQSGRNTTEPNVRSNSTCPINHLLLRDTWAKMWPTALIQGYVLQLYRRQGE